MQFTGHRRGPLRNRRGVVIPVAFTVLIVFAILGVVMMTSGSTDYTQTALVYYGTKADLVAKAVHDEVQVVLHELFTEPLPFRHPSRRQLEPFARRVRAELINAIHSMAADPDRLVENTGKKLLLYGTGTGGQTIENKTLLPHSSKLAEDMSVDIQRAEVQFYGFRRMRYQVNGTWQTDRMYYRCPYGMLDYNPNASRPQAGQGATPDPRSQGTPGGSDAKKKEIKSVKDYLGYYVLRVTTACGKKSGGLIRFSRKIKRDYFFNHDIKLINVAPIAREFATFSYAATMKSAEGDMGVPATYYKEDLNKGGALKIYPYRWGRVFIRGPFIIETEGWDEGNGGLFPWNEVSGYSDINCNGSDGKFNVANTYPRYNDDVTMTRSGTKVRHAWHGWAFLPAQRAATVINSLHWSAPARPLKNDGSFRGSLGDFLHSITRYGDIVDLCSNNANIDPAPTLKLTSNTDYFKRESRWICAYKKADKYNRTFSVIGDPCDGPGEKHQFSMFRGIYGEWTHPSIGDAAEAESQGSVQVQQTKPTFTPIRPFWTKTSDWWELDQPNDSDPKLYCIEPEGMLLSRYNVVKFEVSDGWDGGIFGREYEVTKIGGRNARNQISPYSLRWEHEHKESWWRFLLRVCGIWSLGIIGNSHINPISYLFGIDGDGTNWNITREQADQIKEVFPPGFRPIARAAIRKYRKLDNLIPRASRNSSPVDIDGVIWCDDLNTESGFTYHGRGMVVSEGLLPRDSQEDDKFTLKCPIVPNIPNITVPNTGQLKMDVITNDDPQGKDSNGRRIGANPHFLTIAHLKFDPKRAHEGKNAIVFESNQRDKKKFGHVVASVVSEHGVTVKPDQKVNIIGNLVCRFLNKKKIPGDGRGAPNLSTLYVSYDARYYPERWERKSDGTFKTRSGARRELRGESEVKEVPPVDPAFEQYEWYSFGFSRKMAGISRGLGRRRTGG